MGEINIEKLRLTIHELNNILTIITSSADLLTIETDLEEQAQQDLKNILGACDKGRDLLKGIQQDIHR